MSPIAPVYEPGILHGYVCEVPKIKGSRFIGLIFAVDTKEQVGAFLEEVRQRYPGATHYCYAYIVGDVVKSSDAGEPHGTAGQPILFALQQSRFKNVLLVVVRYFGGTMLGASGLVRTYSACAQTLLKTMPVQKIEQVNTLILSFAYDRYAVVMACMREYKARIVSEENGLFVRMTLSVNSGYCDTLVRDLIDKTQGNISI